MHQILEERLDVEENLPCADVALLRPPNLSREYRSIRTRVADPHHLDSWQQQGFHFFVFALHPTNGSHGLPAEPPVAVFAMHPEAKAPISAVIVTPRSHGADAEITDLRDPTSTYSAPIAS